MNYHTFAQRDPDWDPVGSKTIYFSRAGGSKTNVGCRSGFGSGSKIIEKLFSAPLGSGTNISFGSGSASAKHFRSQQIRIRLTIVEVFLKVTFCISAAFLVRISAIDWYVCNIAEVGTKTAYAHFWLLAGPNYSIVN